jgi:hypothetical protein
MQMKIGGHSSTEIIRGGARPDHPLQPRHAMMANLEGGAHRHGR